MSVLEAATTPQVFVTAYASRGRRGLTRSQRRAKRALDLALVVTFGLFALSIVGLAALAITLTSRGPVLYRQRRVGRAIDGRWAMRAATVFDMVKLRTMVPDAEPDGPVLAQRDDPRVTRVGRFLRRTRIDELPQLWNVLRGDMSIVGLRPERPELTSELAAACPGFLHRLSVPPGITGLAQIDNGYDTDLRSVQRKVALDLRHIERYSLRQDLWILLKTIPVLITGRGAR